LNGVQHPSSTSSKAQPSPCPIVPPKPISKPLRPQCLAKSSGCAHLGCNGSICMEKHGHPVGRKSMADKSWKDALQDQMPDYLAHEIDIYDGQLQLRKQGKIDEKVFAETRLRRGTYGQRYDNGQRHDGIQTRTLRYPAGDLTKGPDTAWDAPGMQRIKVPYGGLNLEQMRVLAELADEYSDGILHVTTRQDFQLHYIHIEDTPDLMRRLASVGMTTREACGNSVRNITACPLAGVCRDQTFDVTPYSDATFKFLMGHDDTQDFGRKFKIAFSGCEHHEIGRAHV